MDQSDSSEADDRPDGQRRQVTVLFADIAGYTPLAERLGEEDAFLLIRKTSAQMAEAVHGHQGKVQDFTGDGVMALFGAPLATEDAPLQACRAALEMQERMRRLEDDFEATHGARPKVRIGIHTGPMVVGEVGDDLSKKVVAIGDTVNLASRFETAADSGAIFISAALQAMVEGLVETAYVGERTLKGKSKPQRIYRLMGLKAGVSRFDVARRRGLSGLVERAQELEALQQCWERARSGGIHVAHVVGEAGIGKSRLMHELRHRLPQEGPYVLQGDCRGDGAASAFLPFIEIVRTWFHISTEDDKAAIERKLKGGIELLSLAVDDALPYLMSLLGQATDDPTFARQGVDLIGIRTRNVLLDLLWQRCLMTPVVMFVEDMHWIDSASEQLLQRIVQADEEVALLVVCAYRPHYRPPWLGRNNMTEVVLEPLTRNGTIKLLSDRLGTTDLAGDLVRLVVAKAEGNPLFVEEIANYFQTKLQVDNPVLTANLQNLLMERFDRLDERCRSVLELAAAIGRKFSSALVRQIVRLDGAVNECLVELERQELVFRINDSNADYAFKHALVQDAIYDTLMTSKRVELHANIAGAMEQIFHGRLEEVADMLAHHYERTDYRDKAIRYLTMAGNKSLQVFSLDEADRRLTRAVELIETDTEEFNIVSFAKTLASWLEIQFWHADFRKIINIVESRLQIIDQLGESPYHARIIAWLGMAYANGARFQDAKNMLRRSLSLGEACADDEAIAQSCAGLMLVYNIRLGDASNDYVKKLADRIFLIAKERENLYLSMNAYFHLSLNSCIIGHFDEGRRLSIRNVELGRKNRYNGAIGFGLMIVATADAYSERFEEAIQHADEGARIAGGQVDRLGCLATKGFAMVMSGQSSDGLELLRDVRRQIHKNGLITLSNAVDVPIGTGMILNGDIAAGVRWIENTIVHMLKWGNPYPAAAGNLILGEVYSQFAAANEKLPLGIVLKNLPFLVRALPFAKARAIRHLEEAIRISRGAGIEGIAARALMNVGLVHKARKRLPEARHSLEEAKAVAETLDWRFINDKIATELQALESDV